MYVFAGLEPVPLQVTGEFVLTVFMIAALVVTVLVTVFLAFSPYLSGNQSVHAPSVDEDHAGEFRSEASANANDSSDREDASADKNEARTEGDPGESE
ncbi:hypothetical protein ACYJ1Y_02385 [Natrialbaceae archaeon A-gly3]